jgi:nicotinate-nucleotide pyrophosphorylase (carboxylating)
MTLDEIIENALKEDLGPGDITSEAIFTRESQGKARLLAKDKGILAGVPVAERIFRKVDPGLRLTIFKNDGEKIGKGDIVFEVKGNIVSILSSERLVLNFMQRLSGIATATARMVARLKGLDTRILDTRKTTPNLRELEKYAVRTGGGLNHRMGLWDRVLIKDNHVDQAGGVIPAIKAMTKYLKKAGKAGIPVEIEVRSFEELADVLDYGGVDRIMLDNFSIEDLRDAVKMVNGRFETEASGGITLRNVREYAETGVDFISAGSLTHHIKSLDMSLKIVRRTIWDDD